MRRLACFDFQSLAPGKIIQVPVIEEPEIEVQIGDILLALEPEVKVELDDMTFIDEVVPDFKIATWRVTHADTKRKVNINDPFLGLVVLINTDPKVIGDDRYLTVCWSCRPPSWNTEEIGFWNWEDQKFLRSFNDPRAIIISEV